MNNQESNPEIEKIGEQLFTLRHGVRSLEARDRVYQEILDQSGDSAVVVQYLTPDRRKAVVLTVVRQPDGFKFEYLCLRGSTEALKIGDMATRWLVWIH